MSTKEELKLKVETLRSEKFEKFMQGYKDAMNDNDIENHRGLLEIVFGLGFDEGLVVGGEITVETVETLLKEKGIL